MSRLKWTRSNSGQRVDSIGLNASIADLIQHEFDRRANKRRRMAGFFLRELAAKGDKGAQRKLVFIQQKAVHAMQNGKRLKKKILGEPNQTKVPKGHIRLQKRDPDTGTVNALDLPLSQELFGKLLHVMATRKPWRHLAPQLTDEQAAFIETGRLKT